MNESILAKLPNPHHKCLKNDSTAIVAILQAHTRHIRSPARTLVCARVREMERKKAVLTKSADKVSPRARNTLRQKRADKLMC